MPRGPRVLVVDASAKDPAALAEELVETAEKGVVVEARNAPPSYWNTLLGILRRRGSNWLRIRYVDLDRDSRLMGMGAEALGEILASYLDAAAETLYPAVRQSISKPVSRRDLLRRPWAAAAEYISAPLVDADACASKYRHCAQCLSSCPYDALAGKPPTIDPGRCLECGLCASSCPMMLIRSPQASLEGYYAFLRGLRGLAGRAAVLALCPGTRRRLYEELDSEPSWRPGIPLIPFEVDCYPSLTPYHVVLSRLAGLPIIYYCPEELREKCRRREAVERYREMLGELAAVLGLEPVFASSLRGLEAGPARPSLMPPPRLRGLRESMGILASGPREWLSLRRAPLFRLEASDKCTLCGVCVQACPEDALELSDDGEKYVLRFSHSRCTGCGACVEACPEDALTLSRAANPGLLAGGGWAELAESPVARCIVCGEPIGPEKAVRRVEEMLRSQGAPEEAVRRVRMCQRCKARRQLEEALRGGGQ